MLLYRVHMRTDVLIDGFNFYHKIEEFRKANGPNYKWLDYRSLIKDVLQNDHRLHHFGLELNNIFFFTAIAHFRPKSSVLRHKNYIKALESTNVEIIKGNFKNKERTCRHCKAQYIQHEEKETDVNIALKLYEGAVKNNYDACLLLSGDNDLVPSLKLVKNDFPEKKLILVTPPAAKGFSSLSGSCDVHIGIRIQRLRHHQFPDLVYFDGLEIRNPYLTLPDQQTSKQPLEANSCTHEV